MKLTEYEAWIREHWKQNSEYHHNDTLYLAACAQGEAGELFQIFKAAYDSQEGHLSPDLTPSEFRNAILEAGDTIHYCIRLMQLLGVDLQTVMEMNVDKLTRRYMDYESRT